MSGGNIETMASRRRRDVPAGHIVQAQAIKDSSYMESMVNFFQDISQVYSNTVQTEERETILWAKIFNYKQVLDPTAENDSQNPKSDGTDPLLLVLGYKNGVQAWHICENGDMQEILSLRRGPVKTACLVPPPGESNDPTHDEYSISRPLLAVCLAADRKQLFTSISITSLRTQDQVYLLTFETDIEQIRPGPDGLLIVTLQGQIQAFDTYNFNKVFTVQDCYPCPCLDSNPISIGKEWLAYAPTKQVAKYQSAGGVEEDGMYSYAATVLNAAKTIKKGLVNLGETVWNAKSRMTGAEEHPTSSSRDIVSQRTRNLSGGSTGLPEFPDGVPGLVTILNIPDLYSKPKDEASTPTPESVKDTGPGKAVVAHFLAHSQPVVCLEFSPCGSLLATADKRGHAFHIFSILTHPTSSKLGAVHHLYTLYRGDTSARVQGISFSSDCRWLSVNTLRGTSHVFPITSYGGSASVRTHMSHRVVNRSSRFHKSAGLEDMDPSLISVGTGGHTVTDDQGPMIQVHTRRSRTYSASRSQNSTNPRLPPHPQPTLVHPLVQIGSARVQHVLNLPNMTGQSPHSARTDKSSTAGWQGDTVVASIFTSGQLKVSRSVSNHDAAMRRTLLPSSSNGGQCLLIVSSSGFMTEHHLEPRPQTGLTKVSDDSPIELLWSPKFEWPLQRLLSWGEVTLPLPPHNPLLEVDDRRRARINSRLEQPLPVTSSSSTGTTSTSNVTSKPLDANAVNSQEDLRGDHVHLADVGGDSDWISPPKTQQPSSRNPRSGRDRNQFRHASSTTINHAYPGVAVKHGKPNKSRSLENTVIPTGHRIEDEFGGRQSLGRVKEHASYEHYVNGQPPSDHYHRHEAKIDRAPSADTVKGQDEPDYDEWLSQVEMVSHEGPARRLWMGPQFCFKIRQSTGSTLQLSSASSALISNHSQIPAAGFSGSPPGIDDGYPVPVHSGSNHDVYVDDLDIHSLKIQPNRSDPMPTPKAGFNLYDPSSVTIEAGSGSFDRQAHMLEIGAFGSLEDRRFVSADNEDRLRERIADAMQEHYNVEFGGGVPIRSKSDSSDIVEFTTNESDVLLSVAQFEFDSGNPSLELPSDA